MQRLAETVYLKHPSLKKDEKDSAATAIAAPDQGARHHSAALRKARETMLAYSKVFSNGYSGWAQLVLFSSQLAGFKETKAKQK